MHRHTLVQIHLRFSVEEYCGVVLRVSDWNVAGIGSSSPIATCACSEWPGTQKREQTDGRAEGHEDSFAASKLRIKASD